MGIEDADRLSGGLGRDIGRIGTRGCVGVAAHDGARTAGDDASVHIRDLLDGPVRKPPHGNLRQSQLDLVWGAEAIAASLGVSTRRAFYLLERNELPAQKVGGRWVVARSRLRDFFHLLH